MNSWAWACNCILVHIRAETAESIINEWARDTSSGIDGTNAGSFIDADSAASNAAGSRKIVSSGTAEGDWWGTASDPIKMDTCAGHAGIVGKIVTSSATKGDKRTGASHPRSIDSGTSIADIVKKEVSWGTSKRICTVAASKRVVIVCWAKLAKIAGIKIVSCSARKSIGRVASDPCRVGRVAGSTGSSVQIISSEASQSMSGVRASRPCWVYTCTCSTGTTCVVASCCAGTTSRRISTNWAVGNTSTASITVKIVSTTTGITGRCCAVRAGSTMRIDQSARQACSICVVWSSGADISNDRGSLALTPCEVKSRTADADLVDQDIASCASITVSCWDTRGTVSWAASASVVVNEIICCASGASRCWGTDSARGMNSGACRAQIGGIKIISSVAAQGGGLIDACCPSNIVNRTECAGVVDGKVSVDAGDVDDWAITGKDLPDW